MLATGAGLVQLEVMRFSATLQRHRFGHTLHIGMLRPPRAHAIGNRMGHGLDMAISRMIENQDLCSSDVVPVS